MEISIRAEGGDSTGEDIASLYRWLAQDPEVRNTFDLSLEPATATGTMGGTFDVIMAIANNTIALAGLIVAYQAWRDTRKNPPPVVFKADSIVIDVEQKSVDQIIFLVDGADKNLGE